MKMGQGPGQGTWPIVFDEKYADLSQPLQIPCGRCIGCRLDRSMQWGNRIMHEASLHDSNCYLTLTYGEMPENGSLNLRDIQLFFKRLRENVGKVRYYQCGEYGEDMGRPHHHAIVFGYDPTDKNLLWEEKGFQYWDSEIIKDAWKMGHVVVSDVTRESALYVSRYLTKGVSRLERDSHYKGKMPEYATMSRNPGIGAGWVEKYRDDITNVDGVVCPGGYICRPGRYYDSKRDREELENAKLKRKEMIDLENSTARRLAARERLKMAQKKFMKRRFENATSNIQHTR